MVCRRDGGGRRFLPRVGELPAHVAQPFRQPVCRGGPRRPVCGRGRGPGGSPGWIGGRRRRVGAFYFQGHRLARWPLLPVHGPYGTGPLAHLHSGGQHRLVAGNGDYFLGGDRYRDRNLLGSCGGVGRGDSRAPQAVLQRWARARTPLPRGRQRSNLARARPNSASTRCSREKGSTGLLVDPFRMCATACGSS